MITQFSVSFPLEAKFLRRIPASSSSQSLFWFLSQLLCWVKFLKDKNNFHLAKSNSNYKPPLYQLFIIIQPSCILKPFSSSVSVISLLVFPLLKSSSSGLQWTGDPRQIWVPFCALYTLSLASASSHKVLSSISMLLTIKFTFQDWKHLCITDIYSCSKYLLSTHYGTGLYSRLLSRNK